MTSVKTAHSVTRSRKALAKRTRKSTQVCKTRTCVRTCEEWPNGSRKSQVGSQVAKSRKFHVYHWLMCFYNNRLLALNLCRLALGGQMVKNLRLLASKFELDQSQRKSTQVVASPRKWVARQTKRKLNASPKLASTGESVWPGLNFSQMSMSYFHSLQCSHLAQECPV